MAESKRSSRWQPGQSGNPAGRAPGGAIGQLRQQMRRELTAVLARMIEMAKAGDVKAARLIVERVIPPLRAESAPIALPGLDASASLVQQGQTLLDAVAKGQIPPDVAASLLTGLGSVARLREVEELEKRIAALEAANNGR